MGMSTRQEYRDRTQVVRGRLQQQPLVVGATELRHGFAASLFVRGATFDWHWLDRLLQAAGGTGDLAALSVEGGGGRKYFMGGRVECRAGHPYRAQDPGTAPAPTVTTGTRQTALWTTSCCWLLSTRRRETWPFAV